MEKVEGDMFYIRGIAYTGAVGSKFSDDHSKYTVSRMKKRTGCDTIEIVLGAFQDKYNSTTIQYQHAYAVPDDEFIKMAEYFKSLHLKLILKPVINCMDGTPRSLIGPNGEDIDQFWTEWFQSYTEYLLHVASLAEEVGCDMIVIGAELVGSEREVDLWKQLIQKVRSIYKGLITYSAESYYEDHITWWNDVDVISSSGYYGIDSIEAQFEKIKKLTALYKKPFFFSEVGCKSCKGASLSPNEWCMHNEVSLEEQAQYFETFLNLCKAADYIQGLVIWNWPYRLYPQEMAMLDKSYAIYGKPACDILKNTWEVN